MNHLLHQITWHQYLIAAFVIAVVYYLIIILRCYRPELQNLQKRISGDKPDEALEALQYQAGEENINATLQHSIAQQHFPEQSYPDEQSISDTDILAGQLKACITKAADKPFAPAVLIAQLKQILQQNQEFAATGRPAINHLVVVECEKTGTALLTEEEVDQWWER